MINYKIQRVKICILALYYVIKAKNRIDNYAQLLYNMCINL